jgi:hypothetical protein
LRHKNPEYSAGKKEKRGEQGRSEIIYLFSNYCPLRDSLDFNYCKTETQAGGMAQPTGSDGMVAVTVPIVEDSPLSKTATTLVKHVHKFLTSMTSEAFFPRSFALAAFLKVVNARCVDGTKLGHQNAYVAWCEELAQDFCRQLLQDDVLQGMMARDTKVISLLSRIAALRTIDFPSLLDSIRGNAAKMNVLWTFLERFVAVCTKFREQGGCSA